MSAPPTEGNPRSAVDDLMQLRTSFFDQPSSHHTSPSPPLVTFQSDEPLSAVEQLKRDIGLGISPAHLVSQDRLDLDYQQIPATVAPSDLTTSTDHLSIVDRSLPASSLGILPGISESLKPVQSLQGDDDDDRRPGQTEFIITLPMAANSRDRYLRVITKKKATMIEFGEAFTKSLSIVPSNELIREMDDIFQQLLDICDLPSFAGDIHGLSSGDMMRHATNTNSKFSFVYEFLDRIRDLNTRVLILSRPGLTFEYLEAVLLSSGFKHIVLGRSDAMELAAEGLTIILAKAGEDLTTINGGVDVVVAFDNIARSVELPPTLAYDDIGPIVFSLVVTYSLEHIDLQLGQGVVGLERKNALNLAVVTARIHLSSPDSGYPEPHEVAEFFANFLKSPEGGLSWDPVALPDDVFDLYLSSQAENSGGNDVLQQPDISGELNPRKRILDDADEGASKRMRILDLRPSRNNSVSVRMSDLLRNTLASHVPADDSVKEQVGIPVVQLESLAAKMAELEDTISAQSSIETKLREHIKSLEDQLRSHERNTRALQPKYMEALRDRGTYEKNCKAAEDKASAAKDQAEASRSVAESLKERVKLLEAELAEARTALTRSSKPDVAKLAQTEKELDEARSKVQMLEKRTNSVQGDMEYSRVAYQNASNSFGEVSKENQELKERIKQLERRANDNLIKVHEINAKNQQDAALQQMKEMREILENRERELERAREEVQKLRNGRRETRQASIPRSPRTGVMSPRNGRGVGGGGTGSRGTSPAPTHEASAQQTGMTFLQQPGYRWRAQHPDD